MTEQMQIPTHCERCKRPLAFSPETLTDSHCWSNVVVANNSEAGQIIQAAIQHCEPNP